MLTALSLKYTFMPFEFFYPITIALRNTKNLVKIDLSNNGLKSRPCQFLLEALHDNCTITDVNLHGNFLDDKFAQMLAYLLEHN